MGLDCSTEVNQLLLLESTETQLKSISFSAVPFSSPPPFVTASNEKKKKTYLRRRKWVKIDSLGQDMEIHKGHFRVNMLKIIKIKIHKVFLIL